MATYSDPLGLLYGELDLTNPLKNSQRSVELTPQEIERMAAAQNPSFGLFPQLKPQRSLQDPAASAEVPLQIFRGRLAGLLGLPSDIGNLVRTPQPMEMFGSYDYEQPKQLPYTTEQFLKELPLAPTGRVGQLAGQAASFAPLNPVPLARGVQKVGSMVGREMADRLTTGRPMLPSLLAEPQTAMFAVDPTIPKTGLLETVEPKPMTNLLDIKPEAPVSELGFYSAVEKAALNLSRNKGTGQSFINDLLKGQDVKKYEIEAMGLDEFLANKPNVTKQEVQDFIANNRIDVRETQYGNLGDQAIQNEQKAAGQLVDLINAKSGSSIQFSGKEGKIFSDEAIYGLQDKTYTPSQFPLELQDAANNYLNAFESAKQAKNIPTKYDKYQLAGGENYRELLLTTPTNMGGYNDYVKTLREKYGQGGFDNLPLTDVERAKLDKFYAAEETQPYQSSHWNEPNVLAHMRVNDRIDADGKKMLLIEEVQSDWHQAGREKGYNTPAAKAAEQKKRDDLKQERQDLLDEQKRLEDLASPYTSQGKDAPSDILDQWNRVSNRLNANQTDQNRLGRTYGQGVPDAPFKDTWYQLALKRAINEAVEKGYDRIGLTTGAEQAKRYDLSKEIKSIIYSEPDQNNLRKVEAITSSGDRLLGKRYTPQEIQDNIGKEMADKINSSTGEFDKRTSTYSMTGLDLKVGGEGMKKYYDEIYPNFLNKYGKKYGAKVGETQLQGTASKDKLAEQVYGRGETYKNLPSENKRKIDQMFLEAGEPVRYLDITPEMRDAVKKGQPLASVDQLSTGGLLA